MALKTYRFLALSDSHNPHVDPQAWAWALGKIQEHRPDKLVFNGDLNEGNAASRWPNEESHALKDEYEQSDLFLNSIRAAALTVNSACECVFVEGNHDSNLRAPNRIDKKIRELVDYRQHITELRDGHWRFIPYIHNGPRGVYRLGQVSFVHGFECGKFSDNRETPKFCKPWGLLVRGHTHQPKPVTRVVLGGCPLPYWYANTGMLGRLDPPFDYVARRDHSEWGQAVVLGEAADLKSPREGRYWEAETQIYQMAWDVAGGVKTWRTALDGKAE